MFRQTLLLTLLVLAACTQPEPTPTSLPAPPTAEISLATATATVQPTSDTFLPLAAAPESTMTATPVPEATPTSEATPTPEPAFPRYDGPPLQRNQLGTQVHLHREDQDALFNHLAALPLGWVKVQIAWKVYEPAPGQYDSERFGELDRFVSSAETHRLQVLLGVAKAPEWSRSTTEMDGPPQDFSHYQDFLHVLAERYRGRVAAYELWNEPNLQREWAGEPLSAAETVGLIRAGAAGVTAADPQALIISAAPATTGIDDGVIAIDDRRFLREMLAAGLGTIVDGIGVHPYGWANPPDASAADPNPVASSHNNHPSFFFSDTLDDYRALLVAAGHPQLPLWVTEFGWGSYEGMGTTAPPEAIFMQDVNEWQQALYTLRAYELVQEKEGIGPLFLWNLNFAPTFGNGFTESAYSLLRPDGSARPLYLALQKAPVE